ncbi:MAG: hypothetical protein MK171_04195 [Pirellulales bacterium]|nr:hypothetical protein [Pirellulales bacterium]
MWWQLYFRQLFFLKLVIFWCLTGFWCVAERSNAADIDFTKDVVPIFEEHCTACHGKKKGLGKLRLHTVEAIKKKAAEDEHLIVEGDPDNSELYGRLILPKDHKKRMPKKADPLSEKEMEVIRLWIEQGALFTLVAIPASDATVSEQSASQEAEEHGHGHSGEEAANLEEVPLPEVASADPGAIEKLTEAGAQVSVLYAGSSLLQVSYALSGESATDADVAPLAAVAEQVYSLNLAKSQLSDQGLAVLSQLKNLRQLHLENSSVTDSGLVHLSGLASLRYLNVYGTAITDAGLKHLEGLEQLKKLYVWKTKVSYDVARAMEEKRAGLMVNLGFDHPVVARKRLTKQLEQTQEQIKEAATELQAAKLGFERATKRSEDINKRLEEIQGQLDVLDGKKKPGGEEAAKEGDAIAKTDEAVAEAAEQK